MRIGIFSQCYLPTLNGVVVSVETFRKYLEKRGHEYFIFAPHFEGYEDEDKEHIFRFPSFTVFGQNYYPLGIPFLEHSILKKIPDLKLDIIHSQHFFNIGHLGLKVSKKHKIPLVYTYHTLVTEYVHYVPFFPTNIKQEVLINMSRDFCNSCDQVVTPSPSMKKILKSYGVTKDIQAIPTGIEPDQLDNPYHADVLKTKWHIPEHKRLLLYLSRIGREKNIDFLFKAIKLLVKKRVQKYGRSDIHLLMVGGGPELDNYKQMAVDMGINSEVTFTDMMPKEKANRYFGAAEIFVFPSITETQGIVVTEAMAAGTPVVAVNKMGPSDLVKDGVDGYLTGLKIEEFSGKIEKLLDNDKLRNAMAKNARKNALEFSNKNCALKMEELYVKTIDNYVSKRNPKEKNA